MVNQRVGNLRRERAERSKFTYRPPSADYIKRQAERKVSRFDTIFKDTFNQWRPKEGENVMRVCPATWDDHQDYAYTVFLHRRIGPDNSNYLCLRKMLDKPCPICNEANAARKAGEGDEARALQWSEGKAIWLIDRADERPEPQLYLLPITVYKDINTLAYNNRTGAALFIDNPDEGFDILLRRNGSGLNTRYLPQIDRDPSPIAGSSKTVAKIIDYLEANPIPNCLEFKSFDYLERLLSGTEEKADPELDDDEDEPRARVDGKGKSKKLKARSRDEDDEDERPRRKAKAVAEDEDGGDDPEVEDDAADEDEDEPRPRRKAMTRDADEDEAEEREARASSKKKAKARDDDDDEAEDEDEPPRAKKKAKKAKARDDDDDEAEADDDDPADADEDDDDPSEDRRSARSRMPSGESRRVGSGRRQFRD